MPRSKRKQESSSDTEVSHKRAKVDSKVVVLRGSRLGSPATKRRKRWEIHDPPITNFNDAPKGWSEEEPDLHTKYVTNSNSMN